MFKQSIRMCTLAAFMTINIGCASLGIKSTPWPNYTSTHDEKAVKFIRGVPVVKSGLYSDKTHKTNYADDDQQVIGITVSGGGMRAAAFALGVLEGLENSKVIDNVDFISTNSGGGWGVAAYLTERAAHTGPTAYELTRQRSTISKKFESMSEGKIKCLHSSISDHITNQKTFGEIFKKEKNLPDHFVNAALLPSETGFVFNKAYLEYYRVKQLDACKEKYDQQVSIDLDKGYKNALQNLPYGFAVATSGSVPLFYSATAKTAICDSGSYLYDSSFCSEGRFNATELHIVDGGIHDNHAYKTAAEIFSGYDCNSKSIKCKLIIIDSTTNIISPLILPEDNKARGLAFGFGTGSGFSGQDATAARLRDALFEAQGVKTILLDFFAAANLDDVDFTNLDSKENFEGLNHLKAFITHKVDCFDDENKKEIIKADFKNLNSKKAIGQFKRRSESDDCLRNNVYRAGTIAKTTYDYDAKAGMFPVVWDLGVFVARRLESKLKQ